jgi:hypothetical protein
MAPFIPPRPLHFNDSCGEQLVFESLAKLPDRYTVFHSLRWVAHPSTLRSQSGVGEGDFVLLDSERGLLVLEVKGGLIRHTGRRWFQMNRRTQVEKEIEDPEKQASRTVYHLMDVLAARLHPPDTCRVFHAVWFPDQTVPRSFLPPNYVPEMVFDESSLANPEWAIKEVFSFWEQTYGTSRLSASAQKTIVNILAPEVGAAVSMRWAFKCREQEFLRLTQEQSRILEFLDEQPTATIQGGAGTGKTLLALEKARRLAGSGGTVLFLCYNSALKKFLSSFHALRGVDFHTFHSLAARLVNVACASAEELEAAVLDRLTDPRFELPYEHVLIDEGQDFEDDWIDSLHSATRGHFYIFFDRNQLVQQSRIPGWVDRAECRLTLSQNCRNTVQIARLSSRVMMGRVIGEERMPTGPGAVFHSCSYPGASINDVQSVIAKWMTEGYEPSDIALLTAKTLESTSLGSISSIGPWRVAEDITKGCITWNTARRFKGLEAKAVLLVDVDIKQFTNPLDRSLFYVGCSRAMHELQVMFTNVDDATVAAAIEALAPGRRIRKTISGFAQFLNASWSTNETYIQQRKS